jgi:hypothetical protein
MLQIEKKDKPIQYPPKESPSPIVPNRKKDKKGPGTGG